MLKKSLILFVTIFSASSAWAADSLPNCSAAKLSMNGANEDECISTCTAVAGVVAAQLSAGQSGFCIGDAVESQIALYNVSLGVNGRAEPTCDLWNGDFAINKAQYASGQSVSAGGTFGVCSPGTYDTIFLTTSRLETFAGNTIFPDGSDNVVKTTSTYATESGTYTNSATWLDTGTSGWDASLSYVRPSAGWNNAFKKLASAPSSTSLSGSSDVEMTFDWAKNLVFYGNPESSGTMTGWYCESGSTDVCERVDSNNRIQIRLTATVDGVTFPSGGLIVNDIIQPNWDVGYFGVQQDFERGLRFLWHNNAGTLEYLGVNPGESGLQVTITPFNVSGNQ